jgi:hypothetical protein
LHVLIKRKKSDLKQIELICFFQLRPAEGRKAGLISIKRPIK